MLIGGISKFLTLIRFFSICYYLQNFNEDMDSSDDLTLHIENIMKIIGAEGGSLWKELQTSLSFSKEEADTIGQKHETAVLQDLLQLWLKRPEASWKLLIDALSKRPEPGPKLARIIVSKHTELVKEEEEERASYGAQHLSAEKEVFNFPTISKDQSNVEAVLKSFDSVDKKLQEKMHEVRQRLQKSNDEFLREVKEGANYWKSKRDEENMLNLAIAGKLDQIIAFVEQLRQAFRKVKEHYVNFVFLERKLQFELNEAKTYFNEPYYKQLEVRIARLEQLRSKKKVLLTSIYDSLKTLSSIVSTAEENHTKCSELTMDDRQYMLQLKNELKGADAALDRIRTDLVRYKDLKKEEISKWDSVRAWATGIGVTGVVLAPFTLGLSLLVSGGAVAAFLYTEAYTQEARDAVRDYERKIDNCASYSRGIRSDLDSMERELKITENKNLALLQCFK